ncbi:insulinase family protein [archaeon]|jgi:predicted Zn-dependent peptidase|nr:insulinase family protein [archaeon]MBT3450969.1 insulinase family protein [archaeon]MBT6868611.1 insulinase family protein [archaeon]MBT7193143.1 insulinase family protein [archaeon]MBT7381123.1 insulinase family protein [archaeon]
MQKLVLDNGLTLLIEKKPGKSLVIELMIKVGSVNEKINEKGISHLIEHLLFEGTEKRKKNWDISNEIEKIGGEFNAYTSSERTCIYIKVLNKHFNKALDVISDIIKNSKFNEADIVKEKEIIMKEINMVNDDPRYYQWTLLQNQLFEKHPVKYPTYGDKKVIQEIKRDEIIKFFNKKYVASNMVLAVVGDIKKDWINNIIKSFNIKKGEKVKKLKINEPKQTKNKVKKEHKSISNTYAVMGFKTIKRDNKDSYVLDVIDAVLGRGQSGKLFNEIRTKRGLAYEIGSENISEPSFGYFAIYVGLDKNKLNLAKRIILENIQKLENISDQELNEAKSYIEGNYYLDLEDNQKLADQILYWEQCKNAKVMQQFINNIKKVTKKDVKRVIKKYFQQHTMVVLYDKKKKKINK